MTENSHILSNNNHIYLKGEKAIPTISREQLLSGESMDGMCECSPAEERQGMRSVWPGYAVYLHNGCVVGSPFTVCDREFRFIEES